MIYFTVTINSSFTNATKKPMTIAQYTHRIECESKVLFEIPIIENNILMRGYELKPIIEYIKEG